MSETAYLLGKRTVDDRALNRRVHDRFERALAAMDRPLDIIEVGAGPGTMPWRLAQWESFPSTVTYTLVDREPTHLETARERLPAWLADEGYVIDTAPADGDILAIRDGHSLTIRTNLTDAFSLETSADVVIASAFLDLVDLDEALAHFEEVLAPDGLLYAPITFDGLTGFVPEHEVDPRIEHLYHQHMRDRDQPGGPHAGRQLLGAIPDRGGEILAAGSSDWLLRPQRGSYPAEEKQVLDELLGTIHTAVSTYCPDELDPATLEEWYQHRRGQVEAGELTFLAHNLDLLARL